MGRSTNALAELADRLSPRGETKTLLLVNGRDIIKAQRIVAELAKVGDGRWVKDYYAGWFYTCRAERRVVETAVGKCLAIAEGTEDGK